MKDAIDSQKYNGYAPSVGKADEINPQQNRTCLRPERCQDIDQHHLVWSVVLEEKIL